MKLRGLKAVAQYRSSQVQGNTGPGLFMANRLCGQVAAGTSRQSGACGRRGLLGRGAAGARAAVMGPVGSLGRGRAGL